MREKFGCLFVVEFEQAVNLVGHLSQFFDKWKSMCDWNEFGTTEAIALEKASGRIKQIAISMAFAPT